MGSPGIRDIGLLESALARAQATVFGDEAYPSLAMKIAALVHSLVTNHALVDGNRRMGAYALFVFPAMNDLEVVAADDEVFRPDHAHRGWFAPRRRGDRGLGRATAALMRGTSSEAPKRFAPGSRARGQRQSSFLARAATRLLAYTGPVNPRHRRLIIPTALVVLLLIVLITQLVNR